MTQRLVRLDEEGLSGVKGNGLALVKGDFVSSNNSHLGSRVSWRRFFHRRCTQTTAASLHRAPQPPLIPSASNFYPASYSCCSRPPLMRMVMERGFISRGDFAFDARRGRACPLRLIILIIARVRITYALSAIN